MKRNRKLISIGAMTGVLLLSGLGLGGIIIGGEGGGAAVARVLADPLGFLTARSPGSRDPGAIFQTKQKAFAAPHERVLGQGRSPEEAPAGAGEPSNFLPTGEGAVPPGPVAFAAPGPSYFPGPAAPGSVPDPLTDRRPGGSSSGGSSSGGSSGGSSSGGSTGGDTPPPSSTGGDTPPPSSTGGDNPPPPPPPPPSSTGGTPDIPAVPEPATWLMLISGMFGMAGAMRHARRRALQPSSRVSPETANGAG